VDDESGIDLSEFPVGVDFPSTLQALAGTDGELAIAMLPFPFCLLFAGRAWQTMIIHAPSPEDAATSIDQFVRQVANPLLMRMGYQANICSWIAGSCPA
jgi:hypothetical protein